MIMMSLQHNKENGKNLSADQYTCIIRIEEISLDLLGFDSSHYKL